MQPYDAPAGSTGHTLASWLDKCIWWLVKLNGTLLTRDAESTLQSRIAIALLTTLARWYRPPGSQRNKDTGRGVYCA
jgi:hypothetical protein